MLCETCECSTQSTGSTISAIARLVPTLLPLCRVHAAPARRGSHNAYPSCTTASPCPSQPDTSPQPDSSTGTTMRRSAGSRGSIHHHNMAPDLTASYGPTALPRVPCYIPAPDRLRDFEGDGTLKALVQFGWELSRSIPTACCRSTRPMPRAAVQPAAARRRNRPPLRAGDRAARARVASRLLRGPSSRPPPARDGKTCATAKLAIR